MRSFSLVAVGTFALRAMAQTASFASDMTWNAVTVGQVWPISWTVGDGTPVSLFLGNTTWNTPVFENTAASVGEYDWTVAVPDGFVAGNYALGLVQSGSTDYSPLFSVSLGPDGSTGTSDATGSTDSTSMPTSMATSMSNATVTGNPVSATVDATTTAAPTLTVTYFDEECGCTKTSAMPATAAATGSGLAGTPYTWYDVVCGCTKTAMAPAPTTTQSPASSYTAPAGGNVPPSPTSASAASAASPSASTFHGDANRLGSSVGAVVGLIVAAMFA
ncbi:uncharacterized protein Z520_11015 [Fonsecaea multimorphosa CBS 102226]|uniref:Uncharacterized protein n=1 Tax=Fonsecaea multimorphosa CBS 102226 TaxID=1442371 RepID=A0A0D2JJL1_9EURO|nr:uncharacterized protein Z520_11015 [Fonsecaea multimorphosa CBS 102226]KIX93372.1 hypothetical protein Z520_11015 [Fonsecaea multimorphosa CBS 102226]OAL18608.1 hypothetical protein AYO22_10585 [Fonsecaea multimorphosa]